MRGSPWPRPRPPGPSTPRAWASSSSRAAPWRSQSATRAAASGLVPSMEYRLSASTSSRWSGLRRRAACSRASRWPRSLWWKRCSRAPLARTPVSREWWISRSASTRLWRSARASTAARLAWKPLGKSSTCSRPSHCARPASSAACTGRLPHTSREAPDPTPSRAAAAWAAATTAGSRLKPRVSLLARSSHWGARPRSCRRALAGWLASAWARGRCQGAASARSWDPVPPIR
jgi:hypothetical protein